MKEFKRCPRCNFKTPNDMARCGNCGLNFEKFNTATNAEAKSAFRIGEKERVLHTTKVPSDINKWKFLLLCILGGWFGLHFFKLGKKWRGLFQILGLLGAFIYSYFIIKFNLRTGYAGNLILICGIIWVVSFIIWLSNIISIIFNRFKYPVSLPYSNKVETIENIKLHKDNVDKKGE